MSSMDKTKTTHKQCLIKQRWPWRVVRYGLIPLGLLAAKYLRLACWVKAQGLYEEWIND